jgi:hypothetical protein
MAKIIFEFDSVEDKAEHEIFANAFKMYDVLCLLQEELRNYCKYQKPTKRDHYWKDRLNQMLLDRNVEII